jgi:drug/metabolite transporter (DMT)-like permease
MRAKDGAMLLALSALWGAAFLFYKIASPVLGPVALVEMRVAIAGVVLLGCVLAMRTKLDLRARWRQYLMVGMLNSAIPFVLIAAAELNLTAGLAAILNATSPLFGAVVAALWMKEALTLKKVIGLVLGLAGVALVVGWSPLPFSAVLALSIGASLSAAAFYGLASVYTKVHVQGASPLALSTGSQLGAALAVAPFIVVAPPQHSPSLPVLLAVVTLGVLCTAVAYLLYFRLIADIGPTRALTVTFLVPVFGVLWGVLFLSESLAWSTIAGSGVILLGTGLVTGVLGWRKAPSVERLETLSQPGETAAHAQAGSRPISS